MADRREVALTLDEVTLDGTLTLPEGCEAVVVFAHGSGSSRHSPRNRFVADALVEAGLGTMLMDLLTPDEESEDVRSGRLRFDIGLLAERVVGALDRLGENPQTAGLKTACFGASTGAAAALCAAAERPGAVHAVVSRGGRPDLAGDALGRVRAPTLLIVGGEDHPVLRLNREAAARLAGPHELAIVLGASHLFEEPGGLEAVAELARDWLITHVGG